MNKQPCPIGGWRTDGFVFFHTETIFQKCSLASVLTMKAGNGRFPATLHGKNLTLVSFNKAKYI